MSSVTVKTPWGDEIQIGLDDRHHEVPVTRCGACTIRFRSDRTLAGEPCPLCGQPIVSEPEESKIRRPVGLLPFEVEPEGATKALEAWLDSRPLASAAWVEAVRTDGELRRIFLPTWAFAVVAEADYEGKSIEVIEELKTVEVVDPKTGRKEKKEEWEEKDVEHDHRGQVRDRITDIFVDGASPRSAGLSLALPPLDARARTRYEPSLGDDPLEVVTELPIQGAFEKACDEAELDLAAAAEEKMGGDCPSVELREVLYSEVGAELVLRPAYVKVVRFGDRTYPYVVDGLTGEVGGEAVKSRKKVKNLILLSVLIVIAILYLALASCTS